MEDLIRYKVGVKKTTKKVDHSKRTIKQLKRGKTLIIKRVKQWRQ